MKKLIAVSLTVAIGAATCASASFAADTNGVSAQSAQEPLGSRSAPGTQGKPGEFVPNDLSGTAPSGDSGTAPSGTAPTDESGTAPSEGSGAAPNAQASLPSTEPGSAAGGSQKASLPFTGYLAIPVLLLGSILLAAGVTLRRRATPGSVA